MARHARAAHRRRGGEVHIVGAVLDFSQLVKVLVERTPRIDRDILLLGNDLLRRVLACFFIGRSLDFFLCSFLVCSLGRLRCGRFSRYDCRRSRVVCGLCRLYARHAIRCQGQCQPQQDGGHLLAARGTHRAVHEMELHQMSLLYPACRRRLRAAVFFVLVLILHYSLRYKKNPSRKKDFSWLGRFYLRRWSRKFCIIVRPAGVRMDSGWNWMPSMSISLCRTPMIVPSASSLVTSRQSGSVARSMISE